MSLVEFDLTRPVRRDMITRPAAYDRDPRHLSVAEIRLARTQLGVESFGETVVGLIVGQNPGPHTHPDLPLFPMPKTSSAGRLLRYSKMTAGEYLGGLYRRNLVDSPKWNKARAKHRAREVITSLFDMPRGLRVVMCGTDVAKAFEAPCDFWEPFRLESRQLAVVIPHPSGMNRMYNDRENRRLTGLWMRWAALGEEEP